MRCLEEYSILPSRGALRQYRSAGETTKLKDALDDVMVAKYITILFVCFRFSSEARTGEGLARRRPQQQTSKRTNTKPERLPSGRRSEPKRPPGANDQANQRKRAEQACQLLVCDEKTFRFTFCSDNIKLYAFTMYKFYDEMEINNLKNASLPLVLFLVRYVDLFQNIPISSAGTYENEQLFTNTYTHGRYTRPIAIGTMRSRIFKRSITPCML